MRMPGYRSTGGHIDRRIEASHRDAEAKGGLCARGVKRDAQSFDGQFVTIQVFPANWRAA